MSRLATEGEVLEMPVAAPWRIVSMIPASATMYLMLMAIRMSRMPGAIPPRPETKVLNVLRAPRPAMKPAPRPAATKARPMMGSEYVWRAGTRGPSRTTASMAPRQQTDHVTARGGVTNVASSDDCRYRARAACSSGQAKSDAGSRSTWRAYRMTNVATMAYMTAKTIMRNHAPENRGNPAIP